MILLGIRLFEGDWGSIIKILINKHEEISEWNSFVEELEKLNILILIKIYFLIVI